MRHLFAALLISLVACSDGSGPSDVLPEALAGRWQAGPACIHAGCHFTFALAANPSLTINVAAQVATLEVTLTRSGRFEMAVLGSDDIPPINGHATAEGNTLIVRDNTGATDTLDYTVTPERLTLSWRRIYDLRFRPDEEPQPSKVTGQFHRL